MSTAAASATRSIETPQDVREFVDAFYTKVRADAVLGLIFDDIARVDWVQHLPVMYEFWETVLFSRPGYKGNPLIAHAQLHQQMQQQHNVGLEWGDFQRWLDLFHETIDELFCGERAERAKRGASQMAQHMMAMITGEPLTPVPLQRNYRRPAPIPESPQGTADVFPHSGVCPQGHRLARGA